MKEGKILVVDDNSGIRSALKILLPLHFAQARILPSPASLKSEISFFKPDAVLLDMNFGRDMNTGNEGLYWLSELKKDFPGLPVVLFTAYADISLAVEGMKRGAADFVVKPWENEKLIATLRQAISRGERPAMPAPGSGENEPAMYWGGSQAMNSVRELVTKIAPTDASVLITGGNGTGKDMLANEIHRLSSRKGREMVCVDLGAVSESLFESELFGHVKGAFTDARADHAGKFEQADGSTLFLDEVGNIPLHLQAKLLRVLQNRSVTPVGDTASRSVDIRLICATNKDLARMVQEGSFREDLYYRINTFQLHLPSLRERPDDILPLARLFRDYFARRYAREAKAFSPQAEERLRSLPWRGNIRELRNCIEKAVIVSEGSVIGEKDLGVDPGTSLEAAPVVSGNPSGLPSGQTLEDLEEHAIRAAMERCGGNLSLVAKTLGISRPTLYAKLKKYGI